MMCSVRCRQYPVFCSFLLLYAVSMGVPVHAAMNMEPLRLSLQPQTAEAGEDCGHGPAAAESSWPSGRRPGPVRESEHRPVPMRYYHVNQIRRHALVETVVRRPDGSLIEPDLHLGVNPGLSFPTPMGDGPVHGANSVYIVEHGIEDNVLLIRTAKWITMHHSCGWGHDAKFDPAKRQPQPLESIPFEIVIRDLWDPNFHARVRSGDRLQITVLSYGKPVPGAMVTLSTDKGWRKQVTTDESGTASLQMIRDYYPAAWSEFQRTYRGEFLITATYTADRPGSYRGTPYERISYLSTLPWNYSPSTRDYASYTAGLFIGILALAGSGIGVYVYRERRRQPYRRIFFDG